MAVYGEEGLSVLSKLCVNITCEVFCKSIIESDVYSSPTKFTDTVKVFKPATDNTPRVEGQVMIHGQGNRCRGYFNTKQNMSTTLSLRMDLMRPIPQQGGLKNNAGLSFDPALNWYQKIVMGK